MMESDTLRKFGVLVAIWAVLLLAPYWMPPLGGYTALGTRVLVDVDSVSPTKVDLFAEGPTEKWALPLPEPVGSVSGLRRFGMDVDGVPPGVQPEGAKLKFTAVSSGQAIEVEYRLE